MTLNETVVTLVGGSKIEWTHYTFNPWWGCTRVSPACEHCYAETLAKRWGYAWGKNAERRFFGDKHWAEPIKWDRKAERDGVRRRVFCASMADVFEDRPELDEHRARLWELVESTPHLDWLLLTKRPENVRRMVPAGWVERGWRSFSGDDEYPPGFVLLDAEWPSNVWVGTTVEDQRRADERIPYLLDVPASVRFLSCEPLLGRVDIEDYIIDRHLPARLDDPWSVDWVIAGGESGHGARSADPNDFRFLRDQCVNAGVPFHFKQWGEHDANGVRVGKKDAGRVLDGRTWDEYPAVGVER